MIASQQGLSHHKAVLALLCLPRESILREHPHICLLLVTNRQSTGICRKKKFS